MRSNAFGRKTGAAVISPIDRFTRVVSPATWRLLFPKADPAECRGIGCGRSTSLQRVRPCKDDAEGCGARLRLDPLFPPIKSRKIRACAPDFAVRNRSALVIHEEWDL